MVATAEEEYVRDMEYRDGVTHVFPEGNKYLHTISRHGDCACGPKFDRAYRVVIHNRIGALKNVVP